MTLQRKELFLRLLDNDIKTLDNDIDILSNEIKNLDNDIDKWGRLSYLAQNGPKIRQKLADDFDSRSELSGIDLGFLATATALQMMRQVLMKFPKPLSDKEAAEGNKGLVKEHSRRGTEKYHQTLSDILVNPYPADVIAGSKDFDLGLSGFNHRAKTLGHDPLLGLLFGTANVLTATVTLSDFRSFHVGTHAKLHRDCIYEQASTAIVLQRMWEELTESGNEGRGRVAVSLSKQILHMKSDLHSKKSLPLPLVSAIFGGDIANKLCDYGINCANAIHVGKQAAIAQAINILITMLHGMFYINSNELNDIIAVKTRKILLYSNTIATTCNFAGVAIATACGCTDAIEYLDIGGALVTLFRIVSDVQFIEEVRRAFIYDSFERMIDEVN